MRKLLLATCCLTLTNCGMATTSPLRKGSIAISADAEGMRSFGDTLNALITNGKQSPDSKSAAWEVREAQEKELTTRETFVDNLFGETK